MAKSTYVYVTYIRTTPDKLWQALTDKAFTQQYWFGMSAESGWTPGSEWKLVHADGRVFDAGEILEADPPRKLVIKWRHMLTPDLTAEGDSRCVFELEPDGGAVKLTVTHSIDAEPSKFIGAVSGGWPKVLSNLKSLLETGAIAV